MMLEIMLGKKKRGVVGIFVFNSIVLTALQNVDLSLGVGYASMSTFTTVDLSVAVGVATMNVYYPNDYAQAALGLVSLSVLQGV